MIPSRYVIITPARNEERDLQRTIDCVAGQTRVPERWFIVDDGSTDQTPAIADRAAIQYPWLQVVRRSDRGFRKQGGGVVDAFYDGYEQLGAVEWDFVIKMDADLSFAPDYFNRCFQKFEAEPKLGIGGGTLFVPTSSGLVQEAHDPAFHVRGATKIYRQGCWRQIGELMRAPGWDTLDEVKANMLGWTTRSFSDIHAVHWRPTGAADGTWRNWFKNGRANYLTGYDPLFMICKCISRVPRRPLVISALGLFAGFFSGFLRRDPITVEPSVVRYLRREQRRRLYFQPSLWS